MKLASYFKSGHDQLALFYNGNLYDVNTLSPDLPSNMADFLKNWEKIVDYKLNEQEQATFSKSADAVRNMNDVLKTL